MTLHVTLILADMVIKHPYQTCVIRCVADIAIFMLVLICLYMVSNHCELHKVGLSVWFRFYHKLCVLLLKPLLSNGQFALWLYKYINSSVSK